MVPCIHPALLVPLLLGAGVIFDKTISVLHSFAWFGSDLSWLVGVEPSNI